MQQFSILHPHFSSPQTILLDDGCILLDPQLNSGTDFSVFLSNHLRIRGTTFLLHKTLSEFYWAPSIIFCIESAIFMEFDAFSTFPMLRLFSSKAPGCKDLWKPLKPCHVGIHWIALAEHSQMSTHLPGFRPFFRFLPHFVLAKLAFSRKG